MPWSRTSPMDQRTQFIADFLRESLSVTELCDLYAVSRKTGYKWIDRYLRQGPAGLEERSRRPHESPNRTTDEIVTALLEARRRHPSWGGKKLLTLVQKRHPSWELPHRSTVCDILTRNGMVPKKRNRRRIGHPGKPTSLILAPNDLWSADFKGQFKTGNGHYCFPLTATDGFSRYLLGCQGLTSTAVQEAKPVFTRLFKEYGLPQRIRTDNGVPFATNTLARLSKLSAWWVRLGSLPEFIEPGKPPQNGRHERLHEALDMHTPAACDEPSPRKMPNKLPPLEYPDRFEVRYVSAKGGIRWNHHWVNVSITCAGEYVGLEEIDDGVWNVYFGPLKLGRLLEKHMRIEDAYGRLTRH